MFRLIKLAAYAALGYIIYELWQGMKESQYDEGGERAMGGGGRERFAEQSSSRPGMSAGGGGMMADVSDESGAESKRPVGRGVL